MPPDLKNPGFSIIDNLGQIISMALFIYIGIDLAMQNIGGIFDVMANAIYYTFVMIALTFVLVFILRLIDELFSIAYEKFGKRNMNIMMVSFALGLLTSIQLIVTYTSVTYQTYIDTYYEIFWVVIDIIKL